MHHETRRWLYPGLFLALAGVALLALPAAARADELGAYGPACKALDEDYQTHIVLMNKLYETLRTVGSDKAQQAKFKAKVDKTAGTLLKWARAQTKRFGKAYNAAELTKKIEDALGSMERAASGDLKQGKWAQSVFGFSAGSWTFIREGALAATLCFYDLDNPRKIFVWEDWKNSGGL